MLVFQIIYITDVIYILNFKVKKDSPLVFEARKGLLRLSSGWWQQLATHVMTSWSRGTNGEHAGGAHGLLQRVEGYIVTHVRIIILIIPGAYMEPQGKL